MQARGYIRVSTDEQAHDLDPSWRSTIRHAQREIAKLLAESPSLRDYPARQLAAAYRHARENAADETGLPHRLA